MVGHFIRFFYPNTGAFKVRVKITAYTSPTLRFEAASPAPAEGDRFAIGAIPMLATMWPLSGNPDAPLVDLIRDKRVWAATTIAANLSGDTGATNPNKVIRHQLYGRSDTVPDVEAEGALEDVSNAANATSIEWKSPIIVPGLENWSSNLDVDILGVVIEGEVAGPKRDAV